MSTTYAGNYRRLMGELAALTKSCDQSRDLSSLSSELKQRPAVDPNKIADSTQRLDGKIRDFGGNLALLQKQLEREQADREKADRAAHDAIQRLQDIIREQDKQKQELLGNLSRKTDKDKEKLLEESKKMNDKIHIISNEVTKSINESQVKLRDDVNARLLALETEMRRQMEAAAGADEDLRRQLELAARTQTEQIEALAKTLQVRRCTLHALQNDRNKNKERFQKVNEALAALEHHLDFSGKKLDKMVGSEISNRKMHEKGLLSKVQEIEGRLNAYMGNLQKSITDMENGKENVKMPQLDFDAMRREMEAIAADKNKLSMEGLLKLEEKMSKVQNSLHKDKREVSDRLAHMTDSAELAKLRKQIEKLDDLNQEMEETQDRIRDKVEKQIPQDLNELSAKADNIKHQLNSRLDKEEEERYLAIKELQEAYTRLQQSPSYAKAAERNERASANEAQSRREMDEFKISIRKLSESVTTVKNVLDKKINEEKLQREADIDRLEKRLRATSATRNGV